MMSPLGREEASSSCGFVMEAVPVKVMTYNIRYDTPRDGDDQWKNRKEAVAAMIAKHSPVVLCVQEPLLNQVQDLDADLNALCCNRYRFVGRGRNGSGDGEFNPIFYDSNEVTLLNSGTFWLSEFPDEPGSKHPKASLPRICTWCCFEGEGRGRFFVFNTHLDHIACSARVFSAQLLLERISSIAGLYPTILCGDFNSQPSSQPLKILTSSYLNDVYDESEHGPTEKRWTFTGFGREQHLVIDYVLVSGFDTLSYLEDRTPRENRRMCSDHSPIIVELCNRYVS